MNKTLVDTLFIEVFPEAERTGNKTTESLLTSLHFSILADCYSLVQLAEDADLSVLALRESVTNVILLNSYYPTTNN